MKEDAQLSPAELATLDALITFFQQKGYDLDDNLEDDDEVSGAAEALEARHDGIFRLLEEHDRVVIGRIRGMARELGGAPSLRQLMEIRSQAVRSR